MPHTPRDQPLPPFAADPELDARKRAVRDTVRERLRALPPAARQQKSLDACRRLMATDVFRHAATIMLYLPLPDELDVTSLALRGFQTGKTVCVPQVNWARRTMHAVEITSIDDEDLELDEHGLRRPAGGRRIAPMAIDLVVAPGVAFDLLHHRIGRGGGYYDRFVPTLPRRSTFVAIAFDEQIVDEAPHGPWDRPVDLLVTDRRLSRTTDETRVRGCSDG